MREITIEGRPVRLGSRAFEILELLIRSDGALVSKDAIIKEVWPETIVEENNLQVHISALRKLLGADRDLIKTVPGRGYRMARRDSFSFHARPLDVASMNSIPAVETPVLTVDDKLVSCKESTAPVFNESDGVIRKRVPMESLPAWTSPLIGRDEVSAEIAHQLGLARLVSIVGAGGIGKTRLAIDVARNVLSRFDERVYFFSFASSSVGETVLDTFAKVTGERRHQGEGALEQAVLPFINRKALFVFDNCEHVLADATALAEALLQYCGGVRILATSRESLRMAAETVHPLLPLTIPLGEANENSVLQCSAVTLFLTRARAIDPAFGRDPASTILIGAICTRLDGIPLAIELAAARAVVLGLDEVWHNLDDRFNTLTGGHRTAVPRHQTLRATLDWSHDLLGVEEQYVLRRLSVFEESFTLAQAKAVICDVKMSYGSVLSAVIGLVSKSLLVKVQVEGSIHYRLLETTRAYASQKLDDHGERAFIETRHAHTISTRSQFN